MSLAVFLLWAAPPPLHAQEPLLPLGPETPELTPADSLALTVDVPARLRQAASEVDRLNRLWKQGRPRDAQWGAERLLTSLHELRSRTPLSYADNQEFVHLLQQAGGIRLRGVKQSLSQRAAFEPSTGETPGDDAGEDAADDATAAGSPMDSVLAAPATQDIHPEDNDRVQKWIDFFTGRGRKTFAAWLERSGEYTDMMVPVLERNGLPTDLIHLVFVESGFKPKAFSSSAASGPWQFVLGTAKIFGLNVGKGVDERRDPERSTEAAAQYLKHLYSLFHDWPLALAAYNSGEGTILRAVSKQNTFDYWSLDLPRQTQDYVPEFMAALTIAKNPAAYGFEGTSASPPLTFDEVVIPGRVNLKVLAYLTEAPLAMLQKLNPGIVRHQAPAQSGGTVVRVPPGTGDRALERLKAGEFPAALAKAEPEPRTGKHRASKLHGHAARADSGPVPTAKSGPGRRHKPSHRSHHHAASARSGRHGHAVHASAAHSRTAHSHAGKTVKPAKPAKKHPRG